MSNGIMRSVAITLPLFAARAHYDMWFGFVNELIMLNFFLPLLGYLTTCDHNYKQHVFVGVEHALLTISCLICVPGFILYHLVLQSSAIWPRLWAAAERAVWSHAISWSSRVSVCVWLVGFSFPWTVHDTIPFLCTGSQPHILYQSAESIYRPTMVGSLLATSSYNNSLYSSTASTTTSNRYQQPLTHFSGHTGFQYVAANPQGSYQSSSIHPRQALAYGQYPVQVLQQVPMQATYLSPSGLVQATGGGSSMTTSAIDQTADNSYVYTSTASQRLYPNSGYP